MMKVLVAVDGSVASQKALERAVQLFGKDLQLSIANVHADMALRKHQSVVGKAVIDDYIKELHTTDLKEGIAWLTARGVQFEVVTREGALAQTLAAMAAEGDYDVIVMGSKGRGSITDMFVGSLVTKLVAASKVPVLVVT